MSHVPRWAERGPSPEGAARAPTEAGEADSGTEAALKLHQLRLRHQECSRQIGRITIMPSPNKPISRPAGKLNAQLAALDRSNQARQNAKSTPIKMSQRKAPKGGK